MREAHRVSSRLHVKSSDLQLVKCSETSPGLQFSLSDQSMIGAERGVTRCPLGAAAIGDQVADRGFESDMSEEALKMLARDCGFKCLLA